MKTYTPTIGLEIHAELKTQTKMFCDSKNDPDEKRPNVNVCPICFGHPGTLPTVNREAVRQILKVGVAVGGTLADFTEFDRKNYFYPDIPKGYQISQYKHPLVSGGKIAGIALTRIHLEEDTARSKHNENSNDKNSEQIDTGGYSLVDFNRAGVPLLELVTEPVIHSAEEAGRFAKELQLLLQYLGVAEANMEKGEMRVEANISVSVGEKRGTKVEVKNLNSFRAMERAIAFEIERQSAALEEGKVVVQETRGWNEAKQETYSQRLKEESHDYRYFPEPDLPKMYLSEVGEFNADVLRQELPELPWQKKDRYITLGVGEKQADFFVGNDVFAKFFDEAYTSLKNPSKKAVELLINYVTSDLVGLGGGVSVGEVTPQAIVDMVGLIMEGQISSRGAKDLLSHLYKNGGTAKDRAKEHNLFQENDLGALGAVIKKIIAENERAVAEYKAGKENALQYLIGQAMKETRGTANPQTLHELFTQSIGQ